MIGLFGPVGLLVSYLASGFAEDGLMFKCLHEKYMKTKETQQIS